MLMTQVGYVYDSTVYYRARYYDLIADSLQ